MHANMAEAVSTLHSRQCLIDYVWWSALLTAVPAHCCFHDSRSLFAHRSFNSCTQLNVSRPGHQELSSYSLSLIRVTVNEEKTGKVWEPSTGVLFEVSPLFFLYCSWRTAARCRWFSTACRQTRGWSCHWTLWWSFLSTQTSQVLKTVGEM